MKKLIIAIAACGLLTGCSHFNPQALHDAYKKTKDSYQFCKQAYIQIETEVREAGRAVRDDLRTAGKEIKAAADECKKYKTINDWLDEE